MIEIFAFVLLFFQIFLLVMQNHVAKYINITLKLHE